jgi:hypothetical protein
MPTTLSSGASQVWDEMAPHAMALGTLTASDVRCFAVLCELVSTAAGASSQKATGVSAMRLERQTASAMRPYLEMFGLAGPVSRQRLRIAPPAAANPLDKFLDRKRWADLK